MNNGVPVQFTGAVESVLSEELRKLAEQDLLEVFADPRLEAIIVSRCYRGYSSVSRERIVLGVEVRLGEGAVPGSAGRRSREVRTYIVKLGTPEKVGSDMRGWENCTAGRDIASRILVPPRECRLASGRVAVLYRDAYTLFGPDREKSRPESLETVTEWAVMDDKPEPVSVERALAHIYTDLGRWFYPGSVPDRDRARAFYRERLRRALGRWVFPEPGTDLGPALALHTELLTKALSGDGTANPGEFARDRWRQELRRDAVWLLCGRDQPDDPRDAVYLDPYEYVAWALVHGAVPPTLVGHTHGDLHGRNVLLGVQRGEADYPAVFDYGEMGPDNVLAWDFVKMESELKVRLLPALYRDPRAREALLAGRSWRARGQTGAVNVASDTAGRADRLDFAYHFEKLLADLTADIQGRADAEHLHPPGGRRSVVGNEKLDRFLALLLRLRQEAALWLGYEFGRQHDWRDEYYFALAVYGLATAKFDYEPLWSECALVSAGVAAARLQQARDTIRRQVSDGRPLAEGYPSHRVPLAIAHALWKAGRYQEALDLFDGRSADEAGSASPPDGEEPKAREALKGVRPLYDHAVPLQQEHALLLAEVGRLAEARQLLEPLRALCRVFGDHETLSRIGRLYKSSGDRHWATAGTTARELPAVVRSMYGLARKVYEEAFALNRHYFPGGNAATLALLLGDANAAGEHARGVVATCRELGDRAPEHERFWVLVSEGEAWLVLGQGKDAAAFYETALEHLEAAQVWMAQVAYNQLCRLWYALDDAVLGPVLQVFVGNRLWQHLQPGPLSNCGGKGPVARTLPAAQS